MILSNTEILKCIESGEICIDPLKGQDPSSPPFNTSSIDLHLGTEVLTPKQDAPVQMDLRRGGIASFLAQHSEKHIIKDNQPYSLRNGELVLAKTQETVSFPILDGEICYAARVEGRSSLARCGILVHFTAPTIHAGFEGTITLEIINLGAHDFLLIPGMSICQLIIEEVRGNPVDAPNQFKGQTTPAGL